VQTSGALNDPLVADRLARHAVEMEVGRLLLYHCAELAATGAMTPVEGSMAKLFVTEAFTRAAGDFRDLVPADAPIAEYVDHAYRHSTVTTIYGGSSEVQRGIIAEHGLGLPRAR
jgi:alkylation response protein AidB-like acyl-CoA dehydrogenase